MSRRGGRGTGRRSWAWLVVLGLLAGCGSLRDRWQDAKEVVDLTATWGPGVAVTARATDILQVGVGTFDGHAMGLQEGRLARVREQRSEFGASLLYVYEYRRDGGGRLLDVRHPRWGDPGYRDHPLSFQQVSDRDPMDLGMSLHLGWLGLDAAIHLEQVADLLTGLVGHDLMKDDAFGRSLEDLHDQARSLDARDRAEAFDALLRRGEDVGGYAIYTAADVRPSFQRAAIQSLGTGSR